MAVDRRYDRYIIGADRKNRDYIAMIDRKYGCFL